MWDKRFGGTDEDWLTCFKQTTDGGYILGGYSSSGITGDKSQTRWGPYDYWIVKLDSLGNKQWDKDFGGTSTDILYSLEQTVDGGYILGGKSSSGISGDKTQATWAGGDDYWIIKIDSSGNKQWDKDFGGTDWEEFYSIRQTSDGGFILGGYSYSGISGDKTEATWGNADYWVVKIDSFGNKQWDKDFGGTDADFLNSVTQTADNGFILGGWSFSNFSGDKSQNSQGGSDYWIIKIDSFGNKQWDKDFGGSSWDELFSIQQTSDGNYLLGGQSNSGIGGDKTQANWDATGLTRDPWIIKINSSGNKLWDRDFGGIGGEDEFGNVSQTNDKGYLIASTSYSTISGDKTENNLGGEQAWILKMDSLGNKQWDKTIFTSAHDEIGLAFQATDGCYVIANCTDGGMAGYKTQTGWGGRDYWIVKFCDSTLMPPNANTIANSFLCPGTCTNFVNLSFNASSYQWSFPGATPDTSTVTNPTNICYQNPGSYDVQLIATNANGSDTLLLSNYITVYPSPPPQAINQSGDTLFANAGATSYQWYYNGNIIAAATNYFYIAPVSGDYNVVATDANGCEVEAAIFNVLAEVGSGSQQPMEFYPNPVDREFTIHLPTGQAGNSEVTREAALDISIYNLLGKKIFWAVDCRLLTVDCRLFPSGLYFLEVSDGAKTYRTKFVKQ
ncbi:hypothetical protein BH11BAC1_BH11BAC1_08290 [soil metagenome]